MPCQEDTFGAWSRMLKLIGVLYREFDEELSRKCDFPPFSSKILKFFPFAFACYIRKTPKKNFRNRNVPSMSILFLVEDS